MLNTDSQNITSRSSFTDSEFSGRIHRCQTLLEENNLDCAVVFDDVNQFYFTGTSQNGVLLIPREGAPHFFVRRSLERARLEASGAQLYGMRSFRELPPELDRHNIVYRRIGLPMNGVSLAVFQLFKKHFGDAEWVDLSAEIKYLRAIKSAAEIALLRTAGRRQEEIFRAIPDFLSTDKTEWQLGEDIRHAMLQREDAGFSRFTGGNRIPSAGYFCCGDSAVYPVPFDGPGGLRGLCPALPVSGSHKSLIRDTPVYIDFVFSHQGYFVDKTRIYCLGKLPSHFVSAYDACRRIQDEIVRRLRPGAVPADIYQQVNAMVDQEGWQEGFMGWGDNKVRYFGHGTGLVVDDYPVLARGFDRPLEAGMVIAIEPKRGFADGMVGVENTWLVTPGGSPENLTPGPEDVVCV